MGDDHAGPAASSTPWASCNCLSAPTHNVIGRGVIVMATREDIEHYLIQTGHPHETTENNMWIVRDAASIVIAYEPPLVIFRVERPEPEATFYTVQRGDTLSKIAREHYGNASKYP